MRAWGIALLRKTYARSLTIALVGAAVLATTATAKPGDLDTSFGGAGTGWVTVGFPVAPGNPPATESGAGVALQPDGRIVVVGYRLATLVGDSDMVLARLTPAGVLDTSYGGGTGGSMLGFPPAPGVTTLDDFGRGVVVQKDSKIVAVGDSNARGSYDLAAARVLSPQGTFDSTFGTAGNGTATVATLGATSATATEEFAGGAALQPDGKVVIAGTRTNANTFHDFAVARLTVTGALDTSGTFDFTPGAGIPGSNDYASAAAVAPDGKIVVAGTTDAAGAEDLAVIRLTAGLQLDPSFAGAGQGQGRFNIGGADRGDAVAVQPDGKILVAGSSDSKGADDFAVTRLTTAGVKDASFGDGTGSVFTDVAGAGDAAFAVAVQANGKILVAGAVGDNMGVVRLQPSGAPDTTFGNNGKAVVDLGASDDAAGIAIQSDGKILLAGTSNAKGNDDLAVARLQGDAPAAGGGLGGGGGKAGLPPRCGGKRATVVGTAGRDRLRGTRRADVIVGLGGNDSITGLGGNDIVCGGSGKDKLSGGDGKDRLDGGSGDDSVNGGAGNDRLIGGSGKDKLAGASGNDNLAGGSGKDVLSGQGGKDRLVGGSGRDRLVGGPGADKQKQ
jgi:uncharacterized delta-60 repeat protein